MPDVAQTLRRHQHTALCRVRNDRSRVDMNSLIFAIAFLMIGCMVGVVAMSLAVMAKDAGEQEAEIERQRRLRAPH
jgi:hypothetical protein